MRAQTRFAKVRGRRAWLLCKIRYLERFVFFPFNINNIFTYFASSIYISTIKPRYLRCAVEIIADDICGCL